jgi:hypothetical protein
LALILDRDLQLQGNDILEMPSWHS